MEKTLYGLSKALKFFQSVQPRFDGTLAVSAFLGQNIPHRPLPCIPPWGLRRSFYPSTVDFRMAGGIPCPLRTNRNSFINGTDLLDTGPCLLIHACRLTFPNSWEFLYLRQLDSQSFGPPVPERIGAIGWPFLHHLIFLTNIRRAK